MSASVIPKYMLVGPEDAPSTLSEGIQSLIRAEWSVIRTNQCMVSNAWEYVLGMNRFPDACCGILFMGNYAYACNGHWIVKVKIEGPASIDPSISYIFYSYVSEEVYENWNPFYEILGLTVDHLLLVMQDWKRYNLKVRVEDLMSVIQTSVTIVKERRYYAIHCGYDYATDEFGERHDMLRIRLESKKGRSSVVAIPVQKIHGPSGHEFPEFSINLSYFHKILKIIQPYYHLIDISFNGEPDDPILIKAKNDPDNKPDIRFAVGQYIL